MESHVPQGPIDGSGRLILPLCPFAPVRWWTLAAEPNAVMDLGEHYPHQTLRNRYWILGPNGPHALTIPVRSQSGVPTPLKDIVLSEDTPWRRIHLGALRAAYSRSGLYMHLEDALRDLYEDLTITHLEQFSVRSLKVLEPLVRLPELKLSEHYVEALENDRDFRQVFGRQPVASLQEPYLQVFSDRFGFVDGLSILDRVMNTGR